MPRLSIFLVSSIALATIALPVLATAGVTRLEIELPPGLASPPSLLQQLGMLLGIRAPRIIRPAVGTRFTVNASAYASSPYQTDATPCTTAAGTTVRPGIVATNFLPIGTIVDINGHRFIVEDRMNSRYAGYFMDIWFPSTSQAREFGRRKLVVTILSYGEAGQALAISPAPEKNKTVAEEEPESFLERISSWLTARVALDPNRYDVKCGDLPDEEFVRLNKLISPE